MEAVWSCGGIRIIVLIQAWLDKQWVANTMCRDYYVWHSPCDACLFQQDRLTSRMNSQINCLSPGHNCISRGEWLLFSCHVFWKNNCDAESESERFVRLASVCVCVCVPACVWQLLTVKTKRNQSGSSARAVFLCFLISVLTQRFSTYCSLTFFIMILPLSLSLYPEKTCCWGWSFSEWVQGITQ